MALFFVYSRHCWHLSNITQKIQKMFCLEIHNSLPSNRVSHICGDITLRSTLQFSAAQVFQQFQLFVYLFFWSFVPETIISFLTSFAIPIIPSNPFYIYGCNQPTLIIKLLLTIMCIMRPCVYANSIIVHISVLRHQPSQNKRFLFATTLRDPRLRNVGSNNCHVCITNTHLHYTY